MIHFLLRHTPKVKLDKRLQTIVGDFRYASTIITFKILSNYGDLTNGKQGFMLLKPIFKDKTIMRLALGVVKFHSFTKIYTPGIDNIYS